MLGEAGLGRGCQATSLKLLPGQLWVATLPWNQVAASLEPGPAAAPSPALLPWGLQDPWGPVLISQDHDSWCFWSQ